MVDDLAVADVVYLGERHTIDRHHAIQRALIEALARRGRRLAVGLEQVERCHQAELSAYAAGEIDFDELARRIDWARRWSNYADYRGVLEAARAAGADLVALNARAETIRQVARQGLDSLAAEQRAELPAEIEAEDPAYAAHLRQVMTVMAAAMPHRIDGMILAQIVRDEAMAASLSDYLDCRDGDEDEDEDEDEKTLAVVICGSGHVNYGFGTAQRVRRRLGAIRERIVVMAASGELDMADSAAASGAGPSREDLRGADRRLADYLHVVVDPAADSGDALSSEMTD